MCLLQGTSRLASQLRALDFDPDASQVERGNHIKKPTAAVSMRDGPRLCDAQVADSRRGCKAALGCSGKGVKGN